MPNPCPACRGSGKLIHQRPNGVPLDWWVGFVGNPPHCILCSGVGTERFVTIGHETRRMEFFPIRTESGKVVATCIYPGCSEWMDLTNMIGMGVGQQLVTDFETRCPSGHRMEMKLSMPGAREYGRGIEERRVS